MAASVRTSNVTTPDGRSLDLHLDGPANGDAVVFHSGTPGAPIAYAPMVELMADRGLRYVAASRPGYGSSTRQPGRSVVDVVDDTVAVLDSLGIGRAWVIGWSGGGPHALACGALMGDRVRAVATIGSIAPYPADGLDYMAGMGADNIEEFEACLAGPDELIAVMERDWPILRDMDTDEVVAGFGDLIDEVDAGSLAGEFAEYVAASFREGLRESYWGWFDDDMAIVRPWGFDLAAIDVPAHIWQGRHDRMVPYAHGRWLADHVGSAIPHLFDDEGHLSLAVGAMDRILDTLVASERV